jgi:predicted HAD superfamily Cof-like phosphohydrolase
VSRIRDALRSFSSPAVGKGDVRGGVEGIIIYDDQWPFIEEAIKKLTASYFADVGAFHKKFGLPGRHEKLAPHLLIPDVEEFRVGHMSEELREYVDACEAGDLAKAADALVDLIYVALGTAQMMHVPFDECWGEVQRANMAKVRATSADDPRSKRAHRFDVVKPEGWKPPDIEGILKNHSED